MMLTFATVVSRESVRIVLTVVALNGLEVMTLDIKNASITAQNQEKIWTVWGPEFGENARRKAYIVHALYVLKSAGASFQNHLTSCMHTLGYQPCYADRDLWYKLMTQPSDSQNILAILLYVINCLAISHDSKTDLRRSTNSSQ